MTIGELKEKLNTIPEGFTEESFNDLIVVASVEGNDLFHNIGEIGVGETVPEEEGERVHKFFSIEGVENQPPSI